MSDIYIAQTDNAWFDYLLARQPFDEVNFWKPSTQLFKAIEEGGTFFFRLKSPRGVIGGFGTLVSSINVPIQFAWESMADANGVASLDAMITLIAKYRVGRPTNSHSHIGCRVLANPVFLSEQQRVPVPRDWTPSIVSGKTYRRDQPNIQYLIELEQSYRSSVDQFQADRATFEGFSEAAQTPYGQPTVVVPRLGQGSFRMRVANAYEYECALTGTRVLPALEAAHIVPYAVSKSHSVRNGLLLRRDLHSVYDAGYVTFNDNGTLRVSSQLKTVFKNGNEYRRLKGRPLRRPNVLDAVPDPSLLRWHRENTYVGD